MNWFHKERTLILDTWYLLPDTWYVPAAWCSLIPGIWCVVFALGVGVGNGTGNCIGNGVDGGNGKCVGNW